MSYASREITYGCKLFLLYYCCSHLVHVCCWPQQNENDLSLWKSMEVPTNVELVVQLQGCSAHSQVWGHTVVLPLAYCSLLQTILLWLVSLVSISCHESESSFFLLVIPTPSPDSGPVTCTQSNWSSTSEPSPCSCNSHLIPGLRSKDKTSLQVHIAEEKSKLSFLKVFHISSLPHANRIYLYKLMRR